MLIYNKLLFVLLLWSLSACLSAESLVVTKDVVNIRSGPSTEHAVVTKVKRGGELEKISEENGWLNVSLPDSQKGWIYHKLVEVKTPNTIEPPDKVATNSMQPLEVITGSDVSDSKEYEPESLIFKIIKVIVFFTVFVVVLGVWSGEIDVFPIVAVGVGLAVIAGLYLGSIALAENYPTWNLILAIVMISCSSLFLLLVLLKTVEFDEPFMLPAGCVAAVVIIILGSLGIVLHENITNGNEYTYVHGISVLLTPLWLGLAFLAVTSLNEKFKSYFESKRPLTHEEVKRQLEKEEKKESQALCEKTLDYLEKFKHYKNMPGGTPSYANHQVNDFVLCIRKLHKQATKKRNKGELDPYEIQIIRAIHQARLIDYEIGVTVEAALEDFAGYSN